MAVVKASPPKELASLPSSLADWGEHHQLSFPAIFYSIRKDIERQIASCFSKREEWARYIISLNSGEDLFLESWIGAIKDLSGELANFRRTLENLDQVRVEMLRLIELWLREIDKPLLAMHRATLITALQEAMLRESFNFIHLAMIVKDSEALLKLDGLRSEVAFEHTLTDSLIDLVELEGIEELFDRLTEGVVIAPAPEAAAAIAASTRAPEPAPAAAVAFQPEAAAVAPGASPAPESAPVAFEAALEPAPTPVAAPDREPAPFAPASGAGHGAAQRAPRIAAVAAAPAARSEEEQARFTIRRGEKVRKIVARLKAWGFYPSSNDRGAGLSLDL